VRARVGFGASTLSLDINSFCRSPASAVPPSGTPKPKNFLFLFKRKKSGARHQKSVGKFFCFGTQTSSKFAGGSGAEAKPNFQKKFELRPGFATKI